jgi:hypothetical protein
MTSSKLIIASLALIVGLGLLTQSEGAKRKEAAKVSARISYSTNMVGELEPCG